jgi:hypothetical protein
MGDGLNLQQLLLSTLLLGSPLPTPDDIDSYIIELREAQGEYMEEFCEVR